MAFALSHRASVRLPVKDPSALHLTVDGDPERFRAELQAALDAAEPYQAMAEREAAEAREPLQTGTGCISTSAEPLLALLAGDAHD